MISDTNGSRPDEVSAQHVEFLAGSVQPLSLFESDKCRKVAVGTDIGTTMKAIW